MHGEEQRPISAAPVGSSARKNASTATATAALSATLVTWKASGVPSPMAYCTAKASKVSGRQAAARRPGVVQ